MLSVLNVEGFPSSVVPVEPEQHRLQSPPWTPLQHSVQYWQASGTVATTALSSECCRIQSQMSSVSTSCQKTEMSHSKRERKLSSTGLTFDMTSLKESLALAEMKAAAASREIKHQLRKLSGGSDSNYVPPKQLLLYLVR